MAADFHIKEKQLTTFLYVAVFVLFFLKPAYCYNATVRLSVNLSISL